MNPDIIEIHAYDKRLKRMLYTLDASKEIPEADKLLLKKYHDHLVLEGLGLARVIRYIHLLTQLSKWLKMGFDNAKEDDIKGLILSIEKNPKYSEWSRYLYKIGIRKFYKWLRKSEKPPEVAWIRAVMKYSSDKIPEQMLSEEEVRKMIGTSQKPMYRALVAVLYESGCRIGEVLTLRIKNISFDQYGAVLIVNGKTGYRRVRIISSVPYIQEWLNLHPLGNNPESWVWLNRNKESLKYGTVMNFLIGLGKEAGIKKPTNAHNFRHSRATFLAKHLTERQLREFFGWKDYRMADVYVHLAGRDVDSALLKIYGIKMDDDNMDGNKLSPRNCSRCNHANPVTNRFCSKCGAIIDEKIAMEIVEKDIERKRADDILDKLMRDEDFKIILTEKIKSLK